MALIVENGTGVASANSYISAADATAYLNAYTDPSAWSTDEAEQEKALIAACQALELNWGERFASIRKNSTNSLLWPRYAFYDADAKLVDSIPDQLGKAQAELALMYAAGEDLFPNESRQGAISQESVTVDVITTSTSYFSAASFSQFKKVDMILRPILKGLKATRMVR